MSLIKSSSNKSFKSNIKKEINSGKSPKQAVAIAYSVKRSSNKSKSGKEIKYSKTQGMFIKH